MAIKKKDRSFEDLLGDVVWDDVPVDYIEQITITLEGGDLLIFNHEELKNISVNKTSELFNAPGLEQLVSRVRNIDVKMDTSKLKSAVHKHVRTLLGKHFTDE